jgi:archaellum biogenesis protein FlaJ (TadC family)
MLSWMYDNEALMWWLAAASVVTFFATLALVPLILIRLPEDYFAHASRREIHARLRHPLLRASLALLKNLLGTAFILVGIAMLVLPGQGLLTIIVGLMLTNLPGKYHAMQWALRHALVLRPINWIRARAHRPPMQVDHHR